jgi:hypothetical protein
MSTGGTGTLFDAPKEKNTAAKRANPNSDEVAPMASRVVGSAVDSHGSKLSLQFNKPAGRTELPDGIPTQADRNRYKPAVVEDTLSSETPAGDVNRGSVLSENPAKRGVGTNDDFSMQVKRRGQDDDAARDPELAGVDGNTGAVGSTIQELSGAEGEVEPAPKRRLRKSRVSWAV